LFTEDGGALPHPMQGERTTLMPTKLKVLAIAAALAAGTSSVAMAQYACPAGYAWSYGYCRPIPPAAYPPGPLSGAAAGGQAGAASGAAAAGPVGAIVGGALGTAGGVVAGTANALTGGAAGAPVCGPGYTYWNGGCYATHY
jgi:hypothetical protein